MRNPYLDGDEIDDLEPDHEPERDGNRKDWGDDRDDWDDEGEPEDEPHAPSSDGDDDDDDGVKVAVDWVELEGALENNSPELHSYLNKTTGDVVRIFEGSENSESRLKEAETSGEYLYIEPISSREQYRWMEEFIDIVEEPTLKDKLNIAIDGKGAFRRFKDVLVGYPDDRELWFAKRSEKLREHMKDWLKSKKVIPTNTPPWEGGQERAPQEDVSRRRRLNEFESRSWRDGASDLRALAHEMIDSIPSRELPTAVTFLEFLRSRRSYRRGRY